MNTLGKKIKRLTKDQNSVVSKMEIIASDGKKYQTSHFSLDATISMDNKKGGYLDCLYLQ